MATDLATLDSELAEIDLLVAQAKTEAVRHETRRAAAARSSPATAAAAATRRATVAAA